MRTSVLQVRVEKRMLMSVTKWSLEACSREEVIGGNT